eukprot:TRINITY_DN12710_c0_g1_i1.p1 TRINITY_DN12710_c0_g1~~TRINITY_DN12710_c0_g1_i1.p1  ORF type:complete len:885 (-),score=174.80 TRINITY_DN12710_c0_g1_i1:140-2722(-)
MIILLSMGEVNSMRLRHHMAVHSGHQQSVDVHHIHGPVTVLKHSFFHEDEEEGLRTEIDYHLQIPHHVRVLRHEEQSISSISCSGTKGWIARRSSSVADTELTFSVGDVLVIDSDFGCQLHFPVSDIGEASGQEEAIGTKFVEVMSMDLQDDVFSLHFARVGLEQVFVDSRFSFYSNDIVHDAGEDVSMKRKAYPCDDNKSSCDKPYGYGMMFDIISWNYNNHTGSARDDIVVSSNSALTVTCENCYVYLGIGVGLEFETGTLFGIPTALRYLKLWSEGVFDTNIGARAEVNTNQQHSGNRFINPSSTWKGCKKNCDRDGEPGLAPKIFPRDLVIMIGSVPVNINVRVPVTLGYDLRGEVTGLLRAGAAMRARQIYGLALISDSCTMKSCKEFTPCSCRSPQCWRTINQRKMLFGGNGPYVSIQGDADLDFYADFAVHIEMWSGLLNLYLTTTPNLHIDASIPCKATHASPLSLFSRGVLQTTGNLWGTAGVKLAGLTVKRLTSPRFPLFTADLPAPLYEACFDIGEGVPSKINVNRIYRDVDLHDPMPTTLSLPPHAELYLPPNVSGEVPVLSGLSSVKLCEKCGSRKKLEVAKGQSVLIPFDSVCPVDYKKLAISWSVSNDFSLFCDEIYQVDVVAADLTVHSTVAKSNTEWALVPLNNTAGPYALRVTCLRPGGGWFGCKGNKPNPKNPCVFESVDYEVVSQCVPSCGDRECGSDGCGGNCGTCFDQCRDDGFCTERFLPYELHGMAGDTEPTTGDVLITMEELTYLDVKSFVSKNYTIQAKPISVTPTDLVTISDMQLKLFELGPLITTDNYKVLYSSSATAPFNFQEIPFEVVGQGLVRVFTSRLGTFVLVRDRV